MLASVRQLASMAARSMVRIRRASVGSGASGGTSRGRRSGSWTVITRGLWRGAARPSSAGARSYERPWRALGNSGERAWPRPRRRKRAVLNARAPGPPLGHSQVAAKLQNRRAVRHIRIQSLMVANLSCVAQTGLESMLPIGTPRKPFSANCYVGSLNFQVLGTDQRLPHLYGWHNGAPVPLPEGDAEPVLRCRVRRNQDLELVY